MSKLKISLAAGLITVIVLGGGFAPKDVNENSFFLPDFIFFNKDSSDEAEVVETDTEDTEFDFYFLKIFDLFD